MIRLVLRLLREEERHLKTDRFERNALRSIGAAPPAPAVEFTKVCASPASSG